MPIKQALAKVLISLNMYTSKLDAVYVLAEPINVGWGKKETQFHGSLGKAAAQSKQEVVIVLVYIINFILPCTFPFL